MVHKGGKRPCDGKFAMTAQGMSFGSTSPGITKDRYKIHPPPPQPISTIPGGILKPTRSPSDPPPKTVVAQKPSPQAKTFKLPKTSMDVVATRSVQKKFRQQKLIGNFNSNKPGANKRVSKTPMQYVFVWNCFQSCIQSGLLA